MQVMNKRALTLVREVRHVFSTRNASLQRFYKSLIISYLQINAFDCPDRNKPLEALKAKSAFAQFINTFSTVL